MRKFTAKDIGAELLPILTSGLYDEPYDAVREYVQNGIDAGADLIRVTVASNSAVILDNGHGMSPDVVDKAIRLGVSEKDPRTQVGFRGIGIYSALHLCDRLVVRTRDEQGRAGRIDMHFGLIRAHLAEQEAGRLRGEPATLWLEGLLGQTVSVADDPDSPLEAPGTMVALVGLSTDMGSRLKDRAGLETYLRNVIPLPFSPQFTWGQKILGRFTERRIRTVAVELTHSGFTGPLHRPYTDAIFTNGRGEEPRFLEVTFGSDHSRLGFCWYCLNDASALLSDASVRGLIVKKFGFSVGDRSYLKTFYGRPIISERVTGEVIVEDRELLPNAGRSDFEAGPARDRFQRALTAVATRISEDADRLWKKLRAVDLLVSARQALDGLIERIPGASGDVDQLLALNAAISGWDQKLKPHRKFVPKESQGELADYDRLARKAESDIKELIETKREKRPSKVRRIVQAAREEEAETKPEARGQEPPARLLDVVDRLGISTTPAMQALLSSVDDLLLKPNLSEEVYGTGLAELLERMEDLL